MKPEFLHGSWKLISFDIESPEGKITSWGKAAQGLLLYTNTGHMSVSINKAVEDDATQTESENIFDSILFYSGTYVLDGNLIRHQVTNASNPSRIGREMLRYAELQGNRVSLATPKESFGRAILVWERIEA